MAGQDSPHLAGGVQETNFEPAAVPPQQPTRNNQNDVETSASNGRRNPGTYGSFPAPEAIDGAAAAPEAARPSARALGPDLLRGLLMALMAFDHTGVVLKPWPHGTGRVAEVDGTIVFEWNKPLPFVIRTLTHLCAPGFTFLLGLGVVYFGASRQKLGWGPGQMARHFWWRAFALFAVNQVLSILFTGGQVWILNVVLVMLAVVYLVTGLLFLAIAPSERALAGLLVRVLPRKEEEAEDVTEPLLQSPLDEVHRAPDKIIGRAADISWHLHNALLLILAFVTIWWNIWLSPDGGHCPPPDTEARTSPPGNPSFFDFWFYPVFGQRVLSGFPPLAWLSFAILGLLYGRILLAKPWPNRHIAAGSALAGLLFLVLFVFTRVLRFGNLTEDCLHTPEHQNALEGDNQYLASVASFFYIAKYPPDVAFWAYTMGVNLLILGGLTVLPTTMGKRLTPLLAYGTSALFFYIFHLWTLSAIGGPLVYFFGQEMDFPQDMPGREGEKVTGIPNVWVYFAVWAACLAVMFPLCRWYSAFKSKKHTDSVWRFF